MPDAEDFRRIVLRMEGAIEGAHMNHPDFRANGRIFATLGYPNHQWGMVNLTPEQQQEFMRLNPEAFVPAAGAWGRGGSTTVKLKSIDTATLRSAITIAWENATALPPPRARKSKRPPPRKR